VRPDTGAVEDSLSELQKVGDELAANSRHRSSGSARIFYRRQVSIARDERKLNFYTLGKRKS
jgi:hypothetical protein